MKKLLLFAFLAIATNLQSQEKKADSSAILIKETIEIPQGTILKAKLMETIKGGKVEVGQEIAFELAEPVIIGDIVYLHKGLKILGFVTEARSSGILGRKGKLGFTIDYLYLENEKVIKLRSQQNKKLNGSGAVVAGASILLTPVALLIPGKGAKYDEGTIFDVYTDENFSIN